MRHGLITGASRGLGLALARELADRGWSLTIDARGPEDLRRSAAAIGAARKVIAIPGDVADATHRAELAAHVTGPLELLVNNASVLGPSPQPALVDYPLEILRQVFEVNTIAPVGLIQSLLPRIEEAGGTIVNITSDAAIEPYAGWGGYGSSKAALEQITSILAEEHPDIRVYSFDPGDMRTRMHQEAFPDEDISDRPEPETVVPALLRLIEDRPPSGRFKASDLSIETVGADA